MDIVFENPGLCHIGEKIFKNLDFQTKLSCRLVRKSLNDNFEKQASKIDLQNVPNWSKFLKYFYWREFLNASKTKISTVVMNSYLQNVFSRVIYCSEQSNLRTPLLAFAIIGNSKLVDFILLMYTNSYKDYQEHMNTNRYNDYQEALNSAAKYGHVNVAKVLKPFRNYAAVLTASQYGHLEVLKVLIDDVYFGNYSDYTVDWKTIRAAACSGKTEVIKYFEEKLPKHFFEKLLFKEEHYSYGTIIHNIAAKGHLEMLKYLCQISSGFSRNPMQKNWFGRTPIHYAAEKGRIEIVKFLVSYTSNPNSPDIKGLTPSEYAWAKGFFEINAYLSNFK